MQSLKNKLNLVGSLDIFINIKSVAVIGKIEKNSFLLQDDQFFIKGVELF